MDLIENYFSIQKLRQAMITANSILFMGALIKCISVYSRNFSVAFLGQFLVAFAQVIILNIPTKLAFEWFPMHEKTLGNLLQVKSYPE